MWCSAQQGSASPSPVEGEGWSVASAQDRDGVTAPAGICRLTPACRPLAVAPPLQGEGDRGFRFAQDGVSAVEFALVAPAFVMMLTGLIAYGIYFGASHSVQQLAADAARASVQGMSTAERRSIAESQVTASAMSYPLLHPERLSVTAAPADDPNLFEVRVTYDASHLAIWAFEGLLPLPSQRIERAAVIRRGGY